MFSVLSVKIIVKNMQRNYYLNSVNHNRNEGEV